VADALKKVHRHSTPLKLKPENIALELEEFRNFAGLVSDIIFVGHKTRNDFLMVCFVCFFWSTNDVITYYLQYFFKEQSIKSMRSGALLSSKENIASFTSSSVTGLPRSVCYSQISLLVIAA
jgi:hypothetical protein